MSKLKYNICFTLGDPSGDGHANTSEYHMVSNYSAKEIDEAYKKATEILGFNFVEKGVIKKEDYEYEYDGKTLLDTYLDESDFIDIFRNICKLILPDLVIKGRDLEEQQISSLEGAAYGIAYHGE